METRINTHVILTAKLGWSPLKPPRIHRKMSSFNRTFNHSTPLNTSSLCLQDSSKPSRFKTLCSFTLRLPTNPRFSSSRCRLLCSDSDYSTFMEVARAAAKQASASSESVAIKADQKSYTYTQLISSAWRVSSLLCNGALATVDGGVIGNKDLHGARIGIVAKPSAEFVAGVLGTWLSGGVAVPLALSYPEAELLHVMNDSDVSMILSTEDHQELMQSVAAKSAAQFSLIPPVPSIPSQTSEHVQSQTGVMDVDGSLQGIEKLNKIEGEDPALIIYTSGTTGKPKGVVHTHKSVLAQVQILKNAWGYTSDDQFLNCLPLHHVHGLFNALLAPLYAGATVEFMPKFSVRGIWQRWRESYPRDGTKVNDAVTVFTGVPTMYTRLIQGYEAMDHELQDVSASAARQLRLMMCGSSALPLPVMQQWETITEHRLLERYGMTEFVMAISNPLSGVRKGGTVGKPFPGVQTRIIAEDESGVGELCIKSPSLFKEYWKLPEVTKESFTDDGFFKTGDAAKVDEDGYYVILGRNSADILKVGGYKLSALEIEAILLQHPAVSECCVLGLPDKDYGEAVSAIIVPDTEIKKKRDEELKPAVSLEELCKWAKVKLAPYKLPTRLILWDTMPRNAMGKVNKKELMKKITAEV
ncbi:probable CoA ligase CCL8 [Cornus florida]|uniref:probable CoA ligase CCL8 n=1 Tax=Cornus florida TaxID=4283 RepID=UPI0028978B55|nr:probable CoA ligase CCL8 [Cornus florida]